MNGSSDPPFAYRPEFDWRKWIGRAGSLSPCWFALSAWAKLEVDGEMGRPSPDWALVILVFCADGALAIIGSIAGGMLRRTTSGDRVTAAFFSGLFGLIAFGSLFGVLWELRAGNLFPIRMLIVAVIALAANYSMTSPWEWIRGLSARRRSVTTK